MRDANISHHVSMIAENYRCAAAEQERPCVLFRPKVFIDGGSWCALYGENLQEGVAGFGASPAEATVAFDAEWHRKLPSSNVQAQGRCAALSRSVPWSAVLGETLLEALPCRIIPPNPKST